MSNSIINWHLFGCYLVNKRTKWIRQVTTLTCVTGMMNTDAAPCHNTVASAVCPGLVAACNVCLSQAINGPELKRYSAAHGIVCNPGQKPLCQKVGRKYCICRKWQPWYSDFIYIMIVQLCEDNIDSWTCAGILTHLYLPNAANAQAIPTTYTM